MYRPHAPGIAPAKPYIVGMNPRCSSPCRLPDVTKPYIVGMNPGPVDQGVLSNCLNPT